MAKTVTSTRQLKFTKYFLESYLTRLAPNSHSITGGDHEYVYSDGYYATDLVITSLTSLSKRECYMVGRHNPRFKHVAKTIQCTSLCYSPTSKQKRAHID